MGVQSTALYYMSSMGELERCDYAVFADTGKEKTATLKYMHELLKWQKNNNGIEIIVMRERNLYKDLLTTVNTKGKQFASIPAYTSDKNGNKGMIKRQCTFDYKIWQVDKAIRDIYGLKFKQKTPETEVWKGITLDEIERMAHPFQSWKIHVYPFIGFKVRKKDVEKYDTKRMRRSDVMEWFNRNNLSIPEKSSCVFCPYQSDASWARLKNYFPKDFKAAIQVDKAIRNSTKKGINNQVFLHRSCKPLTQIHFAKDAPDLWNGECSGGCHT